MVVAEAAPMAAVGVDSTEAEAADFMVAAEAAFTAEVAEARLAVAAVVDSAAAWAAVAGAWVLLRARDLAAVRAGADLATAERDVRWDRAARVMASGIRLAERAAEHLEAQAERRVVQPVHLEAREAPLAQEAA